MVSLSVTPPLKNPGYAPDLLSWSLAMYGFGKNVTVLHEILRK